jgi:hypothetical protein
MDLCFLLALKTCAHIVSSVFMRNPAVPQNRRINNSFLCTSNPFHTYINLEHLLFSCFIGSFETTVDPLISPTGLQAKKKM